MATRAAAVLKLVRLSHLYIGVFIAPAVIFFAITGAIQTFNLHKTGERKGYTPPKVLAVLARIHKDATPILAPEDAAALAAAKDAKTAKKKTAQGGGKARAEVATLDPAPVAVAADPPAVAVAAADPPATPPADVSTPESRHVTLPLKLFFLLVSINLVVSTGTGIYMVYKYKSNKKLVGLCLVAGVVIPILFTIY
jgi:hypothetical protein